MRKTRLAVLFCRLGPYHLARLRAASGFCDLTAIEYSGKDSIYDWDIINETEGFKRVTLFERDDFNRHPRREFMDVVGRALHQTKPDVVAIPGWGERCSRAALLWCNRNRVPVVVMSDSPQWLVKRRWWKELIKRQLLQGVSAGLAAGVSHREYLAELGLSNERIFLGFDVVDNNHFALEAEKARNNCFEVARRYALPGHYFLASSRFVHKKNLDGLLKAYSRFRELVASQNTTSNGMHSQLWALVLLGDGPLREELCRLTSELSLQDSVHMPGFIQYGDLPGYYALAKAFIMPSMSETWGLTVNEAMACGLPVIVSSRCGCASELVEEGSNGFVFSPYDPEILAQVMLKVFLLSEERLRQMGQASSDIIAKWGPIRFALSIQSAADTALRIGPLGGTLTGRFMLNSLIGL
jgi:glycosyltransferase involved in cell wall biosynthesis